MNAGLFVAWSAICVLGAAGLVYVVMRAHMQTRLMKQRADLAGAQATLVAKKEALENEMKSAEAEIRSKALDEFLADIRIEERHYTREHRVLFMTRRMLVRQERIYFRNIPLSNWVEQEMPLEEGVDTEKLAQTMSVFANVALFGDVPEAPTVRRLLR